MSLFVLDGLSWYGSTIVVKLRTDQGSALPHKGSLQDAVNTKRALLFPQHEKKCPADLIVELLVVFKTCAHTCCSVDKGLAVYSPALLLAGEYVRSAAPLPESHKPSCEKTIKN
jgi:hypothetical protein